MPSNTLVNRGREVIVDALIAFSGVPKYFGWGTGADTTTQATRTALVTEAAETSTTKVTGSASKITTTTTNDTLQAVGTVTCSGSGKAITEMGTFTATSAGALYVYSEFAAINVLVGDSIQFTVETRFA